jgi:hypothetical protein
VTLAFVTGATSGLGKALAQQLAEEKIPLLLSGRDSKKLDEMQKSLHVDVTSQVADLTKTNDLKALVHLIHELQPDLIINNAGFGLYGNAVSYTTREQLEILEVNARAVLELSLESAKALQRAKRPGIILNVSSAASFFAIPTFAIYSAAKACVNQFSKALDEELKPHGIRVLTACPGQIATNFRARAASNYPQQKDHHTMTAEKAAREILWQIRHKKQLHIFDTKYRIATFLARHFLPNSFVATLIRKSLSKRINSEL